MMLSLAQPLEKLFIAVPISRPIYNIVKALRGSFNCINVNYESASYLKIFNPECERGVKTGGKKRKEGKQILISPELKRG